MNAKTFCTFAAVIFTLVALLHVTRIWMGWPAVIGVWSVPMWLSWVGLVGAAALAYFGFRLAARA
jgi:hypothetical protein